MDRCPHNPSFDTLHRQTRFLYGKIFNKNPKRGKVTHWDLDKVNDRDHQHRYNNTIENILQPCKGCDLNKASDTVNKCIIEIKLDSCKNINHLVKKVNFNKEARIIVPILDSCNQQ